MPEENGETDVVAGDVVVEETALAVQQPQQGGNLMALPPEEFDRAIQVYEANLARLELFIKEHLVEGIHFGTIPGTDKPALWKAGAERLSGGLTGLFRCEPAFETTDRMLDFDKGLFQFEVSCRILLNGVVVGAGQGSCSSYESKYRYRWVSSKTVPADAKVLQVRQMKGKYGPYMQSKVQNEDMADIANTVLKQAKKRAYVDAVLNATGASQYFTQDLEEEHVRAAVTGKATSSAPVAEGEPDFGLPPPGEVPWAGEEEDPWATATPKKPPVARPPVVTDGSNKMELEGLLAGLGLAASEPAWWQAIVAAGTYTTPDGKVNAPRGWERLSEKWAGSICRHIRLAYPAGERGEGESDGQVIGKIDAVTKQRNAEKRV